MYKDYSISTCNFFVFLLWICLKMLWTYLQLVFYGSLEKFKQLSIAFIIIIKFGYVCTQKLIILRIKMLELYDIQFITVNIFISSIFHQKLSQNYQSKNFLNLFSYYLLFFCSVFSFNYIITILYTALCWSSMYRIILSVHSFLYTQGKFFLLQHYAIHFDYITPKKKNKKLHLPKNATVMCLRWVSYSYSILFRWSIMLSLKWI